MKLLQIISLLQRLVNATIGAGINILGLNNTFSGSNSFTNTNLFTNVNDFSIGSGDAKVRDTPTNTHTAINEAFSDARYAQLRGAYGSNITVSGDFDFNTLTNPTLFNDFTFTCAGAAATVGHLLNLPNYPCIIRVLTGKTITFTNKADAATGFIRNPGGVDFVAAGSNFDFGVFVNGTGAFIQRTGGGNYN